MSARVSPVTRAEARAFIRLHHRHLGAPVGDVFRVGLRDEAGALVGVAMCGRPVARALDDGTTIEVSRVAVLEGIPNACSRLYGACRRAALALGYVRGVTYTLPEEGGGSLRASGWRLDGLTDGGEWSRPSRPRLPGLQCDIKSRWMWP